jgi:hypothetical protein
LPEAPSRDHLNVGVELLSSFRVWRSTSLPNIVSSINATAVHLISLMIVWSPRKRRTTVVEMTRSASVVFQGSEFNEFLFAPIGEDRNGMLLTVLSALARRGVDPWQEAAELALLPGETATQRLVSLISTLTDGLSPQPDVRTIAAHLIARLPRRARSSAERHGMLVGVGTVTNAGVFIALVIFMAFTPGTQ